MRFRAAAAIVTVAAVTAAVVVATPTSDSTPPPLWTADAENAKINPATGSPPGEWASRSCEFEERITQTATGPQGARSYRIENRDGETPNNGERCELAQANTSSSNIDANKLFVTGGTYYIAEQVYLQPGFAFAPSCSNVSLCRDGGLINQFKQTGSCGVPAGGIAASGEGFHYRVGSDNQCSGENRMKSAFRWPLHEGRWLKFLVKLKIDSDPGEGSINVQVDSSGTPGWKPTSLKPDPTGIHGAWVEGNTLHVHTTKVDDTLSKCAVNPCAHFRIGIYRDEDVTGRSVARFDGIAVAHDRHSAIARAFP